MRWAIALAGVLALAGCKDELDAQIARDFQRSPAFRPVAQTISLNPEVNNALGAPIQFGEVTIKSYQAGKGGAVDVKLSGPKGSGHAVVNLVEAGKDAPPISKGGDFFPASGPPIHLDPR